MFTDTHCHLTMLNLAPYAGDLDQALQEARDAGVTKFMGISVTLDDHMALAEIAHRHADVGYTVGVHPCEDREIMQQATVEHLVELAQDSKVWAFGETGLDYYHSVDYIPDQKAGKLAFDSGLTQGDWCPINTKTFESKLVKDIYVIGDAAVAAPMPKSGFSANSQGKIVALQISRSLKDMPNVNPPKLANTCYSLVSPTYAISIAAVYEAQEDKIVDLKDLGAGGLSPANAEASFRAQEAQYAVAWYKNQMGDVFL